MTYIVLDREITVEKKSVTKDADYGTEIIAWIPLVAEVGCPLVAQRFDANVQDVLPGRAESVLNGTLSIARNLTRIRLRYRTDIDSSMRVTVHGDRDRVMQIVGGPAEIGGRQQYLELLCEAISS